MRYLPDGDGQNIAQQSTELDALGNPVDADAESPGGTAWKWVWLLPDAVASVGTLLGSEGKVVEQKAYDPYGKPEPGGSDRKDTADDGSTNPKSTLGFQAAHTDDTTGRVLLGERQYDPTTARFTTPDVYVAGELDLELGTDELTGNRYLFAAANPVAFFEDGHGLFTTLGSIAKAAVPFIPVVGTAVDLVSAATGRDILDGGRKLSGAERAMMLGTAALSMVPGAGTAAKAGIRAAADVARTASKAKPLQKTVSAARAGAAAVTKRSGRSNGAVSCAIGNSFIAGTPILLADGTTKPIEDVDVGDLVLATDPATGDTSAKPVTALIQGTGDKQLVEITIDGSTVVATDGHPFYSVNDDGFVDAGDLDPGDVLRQPDGATVTVTSIREWIDYETVYNFTVEGHHTYYAGDTLTLVHNCRVNTVEEAAQALSDSANAGKARVSIRTPNSRWNIDLHGPSHYYKAEGRRVYTPHVQVIRDGAKRKARVYREAEWSDLRIARKVLARRAASQTRAYAR